MKKTIFAITMFFAAVLFSGAALAGPDQYIGDTAIYSGSTSTLRPNVLILFDNTAIMKEAANAGDPYWPYDAFAETFEGSNSSVGDTGGGFDNTYWTNSIPTSGTVKWARSSTYKQGGSYSQYSAGQTSASDMALTTRSFGVRSSPSTTLSFYHTYKFDTANGNCYDGGTLEYSGPISITVSNASNTFTRASGSFVYDGFSVGDTITATSSQTANKGSFLISAVTATSLTVTTTAGGDPTLTDETAVFTITSDTGKTIWQVVPDSAFTAGGFNSGSYTGGVVSSGSGNPIGGKKAWCGGSLGSMTQVTVNLGGIPNLAGNIVKVRWHAGYDDGTSRGGKLSDRGWYIDDILISNIAYSGSREPWTVYKLTACTGGTCTYVSHIADTSWDLNSPTNITCTSSITRPSLSAPGNPNSAPASGNAKGNLQYSGTYSGAGAASLKSNGTCGNGGADATYLGNLLNYNAAASSGTSEAAVRIVRDAIASVVGSTRETVNFGLMVIGGGNKGGRIVKPVKNVSSGSSSSITAYNDIIAALPGTGTTGSGSSYSGTDILTSNNRPLAEALYDAGAYFKSTDSSRTNVYPQITSSSAVTDSQTSPIQYSCQKNYVIVVSRGAPNGESDPKLCNGTSLGGTIGDYDADGNAGDCGGTSKEHMMDDVAKFLYENDMSSPLDGTQRVITTVIQVFESSTLAQRAADSSHGRGLYKLASNANELSAALTEAMANIVLETDTSFVAPVVPVSPENRTYSGSRIYLGFFKPISQKPWYGNLKKYGINDSGEIVDSTGAPATNSDGSFKDTAVSFWSTTADGGIVESGGVGELLRSRTAARNIYTYKGTNTNLTDGSNAFTAANTGLSSQLVDFVKGIDSYDEDGDGNTTEKRNWILGDILHSKPLVVNYATYTFTTANEINCSVNKTMIYVGGNDGMLHAFNDCDGSEAWAFIPQDLLSNLTHLTGQKHTYFVDGSPMLYKYDANNDGNIVAADGDKAIIIFGERRGGGSDTGPTTGYYYALDVSNPAVPVYMWRLSNTESPSGTNTDYSELGETWSEPKIVKIKVNTGSDVGKIAAVIGAGYDNCNEDARFGNTQTFTGSCVTSPTNDSGVVTSSGTSSQTNPKGRGIYVVEIAQLDSASPFAPSFTNSGRKIWGYTYADNSAMTFSIPGEASAVDTDYNGYTDRLYVVDTGGNIWRFDISSSSTSGWSARKIFASNPGSDGSNGRKIFYKPSVAIDYGYLVLAFGTGDREHPLNRAVEDRMYSVKDSGQTTTVLEDNTTYPDYELVDVTNNDLQAATTTQSQIDAILSSLDSKYGWYIKLNESSGEKVLSPALLFNKVAYYTTYAPSTVVVTDPCLPGNLGTGYVYALNYKTGEAVINYYTANDTTPDSTRSGGTLFRRDRKMDIGSGIPSGAVMIIGPRGYATPCVGQRSGIYCFPPTRGGTIMPIYWRQK